MIIPSGGQVTAMNGKLKNLPKIHVLNNMAMTDFMRGIAEEKSRGLLTEPFSVTNISSILDQIQNWKTWFGSIEPYYALKAQNNPVTQRLFHRMGLGYDCASLPEIQNVLATGCDPKKIVVSHPFKSYHCIAGWTYF